MKTRSILACLLLGIFTQVLAQETEMGTTTALWKEVSVDGFLDAKDNGIKYVEVALNQCYRNVPEEEVIPRIYALKEKIDSAGLKVWSIHLPFSRTLDISVLDDNDRQKNVDLFASMIEISAIFNPSKLVLHPSSEPISDDIREQRIQNAIQSIDTLRRYAKSIDAQLCIENLPRTCLGNTPEELLRIIADFPDVGICFDTNHYLKGSPIHFARITGHRIATLHISDYDREDERHWIPGDGVIPWKELFDVLKEKGYPGIYMYEAIKTKAGERLTPNQLARNFNAIK